jgi:hypothetical protein
MSENGKGDRQRPCDKDKFDENYDRIFGKKAKPAPDHSKIVKFLEFVLAHDLLDARGNLKNEAIIALASGSFND